MSDLKRYIFVDMEDSMILGSLLVDYAQEKQPALKARALRDSDYPKAKIFVQCFTLEGVDYDG